MIHANDWNNLVAFFKVRDRLNRVLVKKKKKCEV